MRSPDRWFVVLLALCIVGIFATFLETLFWATLGGAFALGAGLVVTRGRERALVFRCLLLGALAYGIALLAASPYLWFVLGAFRSARGQRPAASSSTSPT